MWRYAMNAQAHASELAAEALQAHDEDHEKLRAAVEQAMQSMSYGQWVAWQETNAHEIEKFTRSTPSQRNRRKTAPEVLLYLAAYQRCRQAALLIETCENLGPGAGYRNTTAKAGTKAHELAHEVLGVQMQDMFEETLTFGNRRA